MTDLPDDIRRFVTSHIASVLQLEALLLMRTEPEREWTAEEVSRSLYAAPSAIADQLFDLEAKGLIVRSNAPQPGFRYHPVNGELAAVVERLADLYRERRVAVIALIYSEVTDSARTFADAFRLRKEKEQ